MSPLKMCFQGVVTARRRERRLKGEHDRGLCLTWTFAAWERLQGWQPALILTLRQSLLLESERKGCL